MKWWTWLLVGLVVGIGASLLRYRAARAEWVASSTALLEQAAADSARHVQDSLALEARQRVTDSLTRAAATATTAAAAAGRRADQAAARAAQLARVLDTVGTIQDSVTVLVETVAVQAEEIGELRSAIDDWREGVARERAARARLEADLDLARADASRLAATNDDLRRQLAAQVPAPGKLFGIRITFGSGVVAGAVSGVIAGALACAKVC